MPEVLRCPEEPEEYFRGVRLRPHTRSSLCRDAPGSFCHHFSCHWAVSQHPPHPHCPPRVSSEQGTQPLCLAQVTAMHKGHNPRQGKDQGRSADLLFGSQANCLD